MKNEKLWVVILEDRPKDNQRLSSFIRKYAQQNELSIEISAFTDGLELLKHYDKQFDILFMDIELPMMNGMTAAEKVREMDPLIPIIFTTNMAQYAIQGYEVSALGYMLKPISYFQFENYFTKAIARCQKNQALIENSMITIGSDRNFKRVSTDEIVYIIKDKNYIEYHLESGETIRERGTFKDIIPHLEKTSIKQIGSGCMVNLHYVQKKDGNDISMPDVTFSITIPYRKSFTQELMDYMRGV